LKRNSTNKAHSQRRKEVRSSLFRSSPPEAQPGEALGEYALRVMRAAVRSGQLMPGEHLREIDVAEWLGVSRTPVREAFHRIIADGLLVVGPWNGAMVADLDQNQLVELYAVREVLEGAAAALAAKQASKAEIGHLFEIAASEFRAKADPEKLVLINSELHHAIFAAAHNRYLLQSLSTVTDALGLLRHSTFVLPGSIAQAREEHLDIINAIRARNEKRAEEAARKHVGNSLALRLKLILRTAAFKHQQRSAASTSFIA
jgi:DNA-binding GntR family transcriptional regulator